MALLTIIHNRQEEDPLRATNAMRFRQTEQATNSAQVQDLQAQIQQLQTSNQTLNSRLAPLQNNIAWWITHLDLANTGYRVFNCTHAAYNQIPDGQISTTVMQVGGVATAMFLEWCNDGEFLKLYNGYRQQYLTHHRAHERVSEGAKAVASFRLKKDFTDLDMKRGVVVTYK